MSETSNQLVVPEHLKQYSQKTDDQKALASSGMSLPRISLKGKKFRFIVGGEEVEKMDGEDGANFVIFGVDPGPGKFIKTYYEGAYSNESTPPTCSSQDGIRPDPWASEPQSEMCQTCPKNKFGSKINDNGKRSKACRDSKRLWTKPADRATDSDEETPMYSLGVPVTSLKELSALGAQLEKLGDVPMSAAIVNISMDEDETYPVMKFQITGWLDAEQTAITVKRNQERDWEGGKRMVNAALAAPVSGSAPAIGNNVQPPAGTPATTDKGGDVSDALKNW